MRKLLRWILYILSAGATLAGIYLLFSLWLIDFIVNYWWYESLDYGLYFWLRLLYKYLVFIGVTLFLFLIFFFNFWIASRYLGTSKPVGRFQDMKAHNRLVKMFQSGSMKVYTPLSLILAIPIAVPLYEQWHQALLFFFGPEANVVDPAYKIDISFYLFRYPIYLLIQKELLIVFALLFLSLALLYWIESRILSRENLGLPKGARVHLTIVVLFVLLIQVWGYLLDVFGILYMNDPTNVFFGPGFVEMWFHLPMIGLKILFFALTSIGLIWFIHWHRGIKWVGIFLVLFLSVHGIERTTFIPNAIQRYVVEPNELERQKPFIENNVQATLDAFALRDIETREYRFSPIMSVMAEDVNLQKSLGNIPVWDRELLDQVYEQIQGIRPYYSFVDVDVDRYTIQGLYQQVYLSAREISIRELPPAAQTWVNSRLQYTHGYGLVMSPAAQGGDESMRLFIQDIPLRSKLDFDIEETGIYYGLEEYEYAIAPNEQGEIDHPQREDNVLVNYSGDGGVPVDNIFRKLLFAYYFKDKNILFTTDTTDESRILFRRNIRQAIGILTPYLKLDRDPYFVVTPDRLYWIQDAYTHSNWYPYVEQQYQPTFEDDHKFNYLRNSIKIVVDAYNSDIYFFHFNPSDPIAEAYSRMYPGLIKPMSELPGPLKAHLRYPKDQFEIQMGVYAKYHQKDPELFYRQEDHWEFASLETDLIRSYYMTLNLFDRNIHEFMMLSPMSPINRDNLRALPIVGCDGDNYGRIVVYSFPKTEQVYGPAQVSALIDNDTRIAQELTLWDQAGSEIKRGRMIIFPIGNTILYIQPVYLISTARTKIPELIRIIISQGTLVEMDTTLMQGFRQLEARVRGLERKMEDRYPTPAPELAPEGEDTLEEMELEGVGTPEDPTAVEEQELPPVIQPEDSTAVEEEAPPAETETTPESAGDGQEG